MNYILIILTHFNPPHKKYTNFNPLQPTSTHFNLLHPFTHIQFTHEKNRPIMKKPPGPSCIPFLPQRTASSSSFFRSAVLIAFFITFTSLPLSSISWIYGVLCSDCFRVYCCPTVVKNSMLPHNFWPLKYFHLDQCTVFLCLLLQVLHLLGSVPSWSSPNSHLHHCSFLANSQFPHEWVFQDADF